MKITHSLKQRLFLLAFQISIGKLNDLEALIEVLQAFIDEAKQQLR